MKMLKLKILEAQKGSMQLLVPSEYFCTNNKCVAYQEVLVYDKGRKEKIHIKQAVEYWEKFMNLHYIDEKNFVCTFRI